MKDVILESYIISGNVFGVIKRLNKPFFQIK